MSDSDNDLPEFRKKLREDLQRAAQKDEKQRKIAAQKEKEQQAEAQHKHEEEVHEQEEIHEAAHEALEKGVVLTSMTLALVATVLTGGIAPLVIGGVAAGLNFFVAVPLKMRIDKEIKGKQRSLIKTTIVANSIRRVNELGTRMGELSKNCFSFSAIASLFTTIATPLAAFAFVASIVSFSASIASYKRNPDFAAKCAIAGTTLTMMASGAALGIAISSLVVGAALLTNPIGLTVVAGVLVTASVVKFAPAIYKFCKKAVFPKVKNVFRKIFKIKPSNKIKNKVEHKITNSYELEEKVRQSEVLKNSNNSPKATISNKERNIVKQDGPRPKPSPDTKKQISASAPAIENATDKNVYKNKVSASAPVIQSIDKPTPSQSVPAETVPEPDKPNEDEIDHESNNKLISRLTGDLKALDPTINMPKPEKYTRSTATASKIDKEMQEIKMASILVDKRHNKRVEEKSSPASIRDEIRKINKLEFQEQIRNSEAKPYVNIPNKPKDKGDDRVDNEHDFRE